MNKDLVLREFLAIERTKLANERTLLTYIRTALYFLVAGSTLGYVIDSPFWNTMGWPLIITGVVVAILGSLRFIRVSRKIIESKKNIGQASAEFIKTVSGIDPIE